MTRDGNGLTIQTLERRRDDDAVHFGDRVADEMLSDGLAQEALEMEAGLGVAVGQPANAGHTRGTAYGCAACLALEAKPV